MRIAAIQAAPIFLDKRATTEKVIALMRAAAAGGAELCAFSETFLPGYPMWLRPLISVASDALQKAAYAAYVQASVCTNGPELKAIADTAKELGLFTYLGFVERAESGGAVYCSFAAIHPDEGIVGIHRKLRPTYYERVIWAEGDGQGLAVHKWKDFKVGGLNCFENWLPLARHALYAQGEELHVACWPGRREHGLDIARFIAMEGRVYVLSVGGILRPSDIPNSFPLKGQPMDSGFQIMTGGSLIVAPDGEVMAGPLDKVEETLFADIDVKRVREERFKMDPAGHYGRPDVFDLRVDRTRRRQISYPSG
jgi:nitrilase